MRREKRYFEVGVYRWVKPWSCCGHLCRGAAGGLKDQARKVAVALGASLNSSHASDYTPPNHLSSSNIPSLREVQLDTQSTEKVLLHVNRSSDPNRATPNIHGTSVG
jgi:hypothetical protein